MRSPWNIPQHRAPLGCPGRDEGADSHLCRISLLGSQAWLALAHPGARDAPRAGTRLGFNPWGHGQSLAPARSCLTRGLPFPKLQELPCSSPFPIALPCHVMSTGVAQWMLEKLASHGNNPKQPERCAMTTFGSFLTGLVWNCIFC